MTYEYTLRNVFAFYFALYTFPSSQFRILYRAISRPSNQPAFGKLPTEVAGVVVALVVVAAVVVVVLCVVVATVVVENFSNINNNKYQTQTAAIVAALVYIRNNRQVALKCAV